MICDENSLLKNLIQPKSIKKVKYIVLLRQIVAIMLDQDNAQFLRKRRPPKGVV